MSTGIFGVVRKLLFARKIRGFSHSRPSLGQLPKLIVDDLIQLYICRHDVGAGAPARLTFNGFPVACTVGLAGDDHLLER